MKLTSEQFKKFVLAEVRKIAIEEGWAMPDSEKESAPLTPSVATTELHKDDKPEIKDMIAEAEEELIKLNPETVNEDFSSVNEEGKEIDNTLSEAKQMSEEFKRMRFLIDFRRPLFPER